MQNKYKYKFSIVMPIYKVEKYLEEAIESVINQTIGFKESVQLILVNDGSPDNSEEICLKYYKKYPKNIEYIKKTNGGLSSARNEGLKKIKGKYVNFMDPDDKINSKTLKEVFSFFENNYNLIDFVSIPLYLFEASTGLHVKYKYMGKKNRIINLINEPHNFVLSSAASFYKKETFEKFNYDEKLSNSEDLDLNIKLYINNPYFGYVCENGVKYMYRQRNDDSSIVSSNLRKEKNFINVLTLFSKNKNNIHNYLFIKEIIIYQLKNHIKYLNIKAFSSENKYNEVVSFYKSLIDFVKIEYIINESKWCSSVHEKILFINFYYEHYKLSVDNNFNVIYKDNIKLFIDSLSSFHLILKYSKIEKNYFYIDILYYDFGLDSVQLIIKDGTGKIYKPYFEKTISSPYDMILGDVKLSKTHLCKFKINLSKLKRLYFYFQTDSGAIKINNFKMSENCPFHLKHNKLRIFNDNNIISFKKNRFVIRHKKQSLLKYNIGSFLRIYKKYKIFCFLRLLNVKNKKYILIMDRPNAAKDNGEAIFKYMSSLKSNEKKYVYFIISRKSEDYKRLKKYGKVIDKDSLFHKFLYINSKLILTSHVHPLFYKAFSIQENKYYVDILNFDLVWLQHGVIYNDLSNGANKYTHNIKKFVVSSKIDFTECNQEKYMYFDDEIIQTGLPRYDYLYNNEKNYISIIPTWRNNLTGKIVSSGNHEEIIDITQTEYYKNYADLLTNNKLKKILKKYKLTIYFVLHPGMLNYKKYFEKFSSENILICDSTKTNYSTVFAESKLLITDYSSVFFDFAYLKKPEIYFQFDQKSFFDKHYPKGIFSYEKDGFGDVLLSVDEVIKKIEYYINNDFKMEEKYIKRVENTFAYTDKKNCERVYNEIIKLYNEK